MTQALSWQMSVAQRTNIHNPFTGLVTILTIIYRPITIVDSITDLNGTVKCSIASLVNYKYCRTNYYLTVLKLGSKFLDLLLV